MGGWGMMSGERRGRAGPGSVLDSRPHRRMGPKLLPDKPADGRSRFELSARQTRNCKPRSTW